jgi:hypothetical protein
MFKQRLQSQDLMMPSTSTDNDDTVRPAALATPVTAILFRREQHPQSFPVSVSATPTQGSFVCF